MRMKELKVNKQKALKYVNPILAADFVLLAASGLFRSFIPYDIYRIVHPWMGYLLAALVATHIYLNWAWVKQNYLKPKKKAD